VNTRVPDTDAPEALAEVLSALGHPVRIRVIRQCREGVKQSPSRLHGALPDIPLGTLAYHVRQLAGAGLLERAGGVARRGAIEHMYLLSPRGVRMARLLEELRKRL
jgi:DNA-binding transcriptional ArsR family regulator